MILAMMCSVKYSYQKIHTSRGKKDRERGGGGGLLEVLHFVGSRKLEGLVARGGRHPSSLGHTYLTSRHVLALVRTKANQTNLLLIDDDFDTDNLLEGSQEDFGVLLGEACLFLQLCQ